MLKDILKTFISAEFKLRGAFLQAYMYHIENCSVGQTIYTLDGEISIQDCPEYYQLNLKDSGKQAMLRVRKYPLYIFDVDTNKNVKNNILNNLNIINTAYDGHTKTSNLLEKYPELKLY